MTELVLHRLTAETDLSEFNCGLEIMDSFIHSQLLSVLSENQNYSGYYLCKETEIVALFVIDVENIEIIDDDTVDDLRLNYCVAPEGRVFHSLEILYLAVKDIYRGQAIGSTCMDIIVNMARQSSNIGIHFITVDAYKSSGYTAVPFYHAMHFIESEYVNPNKNTIRMIRPVDI